MRVYELAKELGLENKRVLELCAELGIDGKKSHSNSLTDDEADKVRRSVIRQAVSGSGQGTKEIMIGGTPGIEQRKGNIIRRRRKAESEEEAATEEEAEKSETEQIDVSAPISPGFGSSSPDLAQERDQRNEALAAANALFGSDDSAPEGKDSTAAEDATSEEAVAEDSSAESTEEIATSAEGETEVSAVAEAGEMAEEEETETGEDSTEESASDKLDLAETRKRHDVRAPKVLGKIDLPKAPTPPPKKEKERPAGRATAAVEVGPSEPDWEDGTSGPKKAAAGKGKRRGADIKGSEGVGRPKRKGRKQILRKDDLLDYDSDRDGWRSKRDKRKKPKADSSQSAVAETKASKKVVKLDNEISVGELSKQMSAKAGDVIKELMNLGVMASINQLVDFDTATLVASEFGFTVANTGHDELEFLKEIRAATEEGAQVLRPPVVTVMGHVDHGKTSLLDAIRQTDVTESEAGGITQHIGAYNVKLPTGGSVTFIDTPGHEAFTAMRSRGAKVTDIVVLVVAADDGVMPQTIEAINHAKAAEVPIIVAINKIDKEEANQDKIKNQLAEYDLIPEDWGGDTMMVPVSAITRDGVGTLLETLNLQSEIMELKANPDRDAYGVVIESTLDKGRGPVITVLIQNGTLKQGDIFLAGSVTGRARALIGDHGDRVESAGPGIPVEVLGSSSTPEAGTEFYVLETEAQARDVASHRGIRERNRQLAAKGGVLSAAPLSLESFAEMVKQGEVKELPVIIKADVGGSLEAVRESVMSCGNEEVGVKVVHSGVGAVTENDIQLASASNAIILGFNVRQDYHAQEVAEKTGVDIRFFTVIYELVDSLKSALTGMLAPVIKEKTLGRAEVRQTFRVPKLGMVAGSYVIDGAIERGSHVRLLRDNIVVFEGKLASLRRFKDDVKEVATGYECGIGIEGYSDIKDGDIIEAFKLEETAATL